MMLPMLPECILEAACGKSLPGRKCTLGTRFEFRALSIFILIFSAVSGPRTCAYQSFSYTHIMEYTGTPSVPSDDSIHEEISSASSMRHPAKLAGVKRSPAISTAQLDQLDTSCTLLEAMASTDLSGPAGIVMQQCMGAVAWDQVHQHRPLPYNYAADCTNAEFTQTCKEWMRVCVAMAGQQRA